MAPLCVRCSVSGAVRPQDQAGLPSFGTTTLCLSCVRKGSGYSQSTKRRKAKRSDSNLFLFPHQSQVSGASKEGARRRPKRKVNGPRGEGSVRPTTGPLFAFIMRRCSTYYPISEKLRHRPRPAVTLPSTHPPLHSFLVPCCLWFRFRGVGLWA